MTMQFSLTENDHVSFYVYPIFKRKSSAAIFWLMKFVFAPVFVALSAFSFYVKLIPLALVCMVLCVLVYLYGARAKQFYKWLYLSLMKKHFKDKTGNVTIELNDSGIILTGKDSQTALKPPIFKGVVELKEVIFLTIGYKRAIIISKSDSAHLPEFITLLQSLATTWGIPYEADLGWKL